MSPGGDATWAQNFEVTWNEMPKGLKKALQQNKRPSPSDRRAFVRKVVEQMRTYHSNPNKAQTVCVARKIVQQYPSSFEDRVDEGERLGSGYHSLCMQLKTRIEHVNRSDTLHRLRKPRKKLDADKGAHSANPADKYGCVQWQPEDVPDDETEESLEEKRAQLEKLFEEKGPNAAQRAQVDKEMKETYYLQRKHINSKPAISELRQKWPFLFMQRYLCQHFETLTNIAVNTRLEEALNRKGERIRRYFESLGDSAKKGVQAVLKDQRAAAQDVENEEDLHGPAVVLMMMSSFNEESKSIFLLTDVSAY